MTAKKPPSDSELPELPPGAVRGLTKTQINSIRTRVGKWIRNPMAAKRWILVRHGMIVARFGDMLMESDYETRGQLKDEIREFQEWASLFGEMLSGFRKELDEAGPDAAEVDDDDDEEGGATRAPAEPLPWTGDRSR